MFNNVCVLHHPQLILKKNLLGVDGLLSSHGENKVNYRVYNKVYTRFAIARIQGCIIYKNAKIGKSGTR
jgi:hypothetical protein